MPKRVYSPEQISAALALAAIRPRPRIQDIAQIVGMSFNTARYYAEGRHLHTPPEQWATDIIDAMKAKTNGNDVLAAYHLVAAAKILMKQTRQ